MLGSADREHVYSSDRSAAKKLTMAMEDAKLQRVPYCECHISSNLNVCVIDRCYFTVHAD